VPSVAALASAGLDRSDHRASIRLRSPPPEDPGFTQRQNGIEEPAGDSFALDQRFSNCSRRSIAGWAGINERGLRDCHQNPVSGGAASFTECASATPMRMPNLSIQPFLSIIGASRIGGRSLVNDRAVFRRRKNSRKTENIRALRAALNTLGDGLVEGDRRQHAGDLAAQQVSATHGKIHGEAIAVPGGGGARETNRIGSLAEGPAQFSGFLSLRRLLMGWDVNKPFAAEGCDDEKTGKVTTEPRMCTDIWSADIEHLRQLSRPRRPQSRDTDLAASAGAQAGRRVREDRLQICFFFQSKPFTRRRREQ